MRKGFLTMQNFGSDSARQTHVLKSRIGFRTPDSRSIGSDSRASCILVCLQVFKESSEQSLSLTRDKSMPSITSLFVFHTAAWDYVLAGVRGTPT